MNSYRLLGVYLSMLGLLFLMLGRLVTENVVHEAFGIACTIIGVTLILIPFEERWKAVTRTLTHMLLDFYANTERLLKELNLRKPGIYAKIIVGETDDVRVFIPFSDRINPPTTDIGGLVQEEEGEPLLALYPPGRALIVTARERGLIFSGEEISAIETSLNSLLVDYSELCRKVSVGRAGEEVIVTLDGCLKELLEAPKLFPRVTESIGSPYASLIASIVAFVTSRPVRIRAEEISNSSIKVRLEAYE